MISVLLGIIFIAILFTQFLVDIDKDRNYYIELSNNRKLKKELEESDKEIRRLKSRISYIKLYGDEGYHCE